MILPAQTLDGPSEDIVAFGGVAMAEDGSGGLVYLKSVEGVPHVFVCRYDGGHWLAPIRVDTEEPFAASWPRIGAAAGGELIVVWATPFATSPITGKPVYELLGAVLGPGGERFGQAMIVDRNIEEGTGTSPDLAVSSTGQADVVYRVIHTDKVGVTPLRPGDVPESVRVAHFNGRRWSGLGAINRDPAVGMRPPTPANAPQVAIGPTGSGVVVWQEPEIEGVARIWARRIFGATLDYSLPVTATSYGGAPISDDADAPSVAFSRLGQAEVAYRQTAGPSSPLPGPRIFLNILPDGESASGTEFRGASVVDQAVAGGKGAAVGPPSIDIDEQPEHAPALRQQRHAARGRRQRPRALRRALAGLSIRRRRTVRRERHESRRRRGLGLAQRRSAGPSRGGGARGLPQRGRADGVGERRRRRRSRANSRSGARASGMA